MAHLLERRELAELMSYADKNMASSQTLDSFSCREQRDEGGKVSVVEQDDEGGEAAAGEHEHPRPAAPCVLFRVGFLPCLCLAGWKNS